MKRLLVVWLTLVVFLVGCQASGYEAYEEAVAKTETIERAKSITEMNMSYTFNDEGLSEEVKRQLNNFKDVGFESTTSYDSALEATAMDLFISLGGMGFSSEFIKVGQEAVIKMPVLEKYMTLAELQKFNEASNTAPVDYNNMVTAETIEQIEKDWNDMVLSGQVVRGEKDILETPEGAVRVTKYDISPDPQALTAFFRQTADMIMNDPQVQDYLEKTQAEASDQGASLDLKAILSDWVDQVEIAKIQLVDYIDVDGYIVDETINFELQFTDAGPGSMTHMTFELHSKIYEINKDQNIQLPELNENNTLTVDQLKTDMPASFENLINQ